MTSVADSPHSDTSTGACVRTKLGGHNGQATLEPAVGLVEGLCLLDPTLVASLALDSIPAGLNLQHDRAEPSLLPASGSKAT